jgi:hypothetical protein
MIYGRTVAFTPGGRVRDYDHRHEYQPLPEGDIFERLFVDSCFIAQSSVCIRSALLREIEEIPDEIQVTPDYYLYLELAHRAPVRAVQSVVTRYRLHPGSMSRRTGRRMHEEALCLLDWWKDRIDPELLVRRRRVHYTLVSLTYIFHWKTAWYGLRMLVERGSPAFLFSRPFARGFRLIRRRIRTPFWRSPETMCHTAGCAG